EIAAGKAGRTITVDRLAEICLELQAAGALNINMVTPTHYGPHIIEAVAKARAAGLTLPVVYNTSGYETVEAVRAAADTADIWLTDFKYASSEVAAAYSHAPDYPEVALAALDAMVEQTGEATFDEVDGEMRMRSGIIVRHLLLPGHLDDSMAVVRLLHERYGDAISLSLMNQYTPIIAPDSPAARRHPNLLARVPDEDYERLLDYADDLGISEYYWQDGPAASESFIPAFDYTGV
ncbi:MAG: radical SAM protein, partial [Eggerthellaceae bacterium]|nr:radical SAM protein [Eggerthellaceae bacterium]